MTDFARNIYLGTVLLERNRWTTPRVPSFLVSEWLERAAQAGFDGIELWEYHATMASEEEVAALEAAPLPIPIFNSYASCDDDGAESRRQATEIAIRLGSRRIKFNVGKDESRRETYIANVRAWLESLPAGIDLLCECHPGTLMETPEVAAEFFRAWDTPRIRAIIHPLIVDVSVVQDWFRHLGPIISHAHIQASDENNLRVRLSRRADHVKEVLRIMREAGFQGSYTIEFTEGVATPDEKMDVLFENAVDDLAFLRENIT